MNIQVKFNSLNQYLFGHISSCDMPSQHLNSTLSFHIKLHLGKLSSHLIRVGSWQPEKYSPAPKPFSVFDRVCRDMTQIWLLQKIHKYLKKRGKKKMYIKFQCISYFRKKLYGYTVILNLSKMGLDLDSVYKGLPSLSTLCPMGSHPRTGHQAGSAMATRRPSLLCIKWQ
jgi:hypothetical protein